MTRTRRRPLGRSTLGVALASVALLAAACSSSSSSSSSTTTASTLPTTQIPTQTKVAAVAQLVPTSIASSGQITFAMDATYPPDEFIAPGTNTIVGMDADLGKAIAQTMGLKAKLVNATFSTIIPGLAAGKYDMGASSFTDTKARQKVVDFVDYFSAGESFYVKTGSPTFTSLQSLCGHSVAVESGTTEETDAKTQAAKCVAAGKPKVDVLTFSTQTEANVAVSSGRADAGFADSPVAAYIVATSNGVFQNSGAPIGVAPYGLALPKGNGMAAPVQSAVNLLITNGVYTQILTKWGLQAGAITTATVNSATS